MSQHDSHPPIVKNAIEAHEGVTGYNMRYVLALSLIGVVMTFGVL